MRTAFIAGLVGSTALALGAAAQTQPQVAPNTMPQGEAQAKAAVVECDRLLAVLDSNRPVAGVTAEQARRWKQDSQPEACRTALERVTQASKPADDGQQNAPRQQSQVGSPQAQAPQPEPQDRQQAANPASTSGAAATSRIVVQQAQPSVTVRQGQPEIIVRMPPPVITVQQAQPEIIVRMPEPDVNVGVARPEVQVTLPQPQVQVEAPSQQTEANVQVERQQPNVRVERTGEPQIVYQPAEGQPQIRFEPMGAQTAAGSGTATAPQGAASTPPASRTAAQAQLNATTSGYGTTPGLAGAPGDATQAAGPSAERPRASPEPSATGALPSPGQQLAVAKLSEMTVYTARNEKLGDVDSVVASPDGKVQLVIGHGGFLGLGERKVLMPLDQLALQEGRLVAEHLTDEQIKALPEFEKGERFRELDGRHTAPVRVLR